MSWQPADDGEPRRISSLLDHVAGRLDVPATNVLSAVFAHWSELVGDVVAAHAQPHSLVKGRLIVSVDSPAWATQLRLLAGELLDRLADRIGPGQVAAVELRVHR